ncbi:MAG: hypothetical protein LBS16_01785 [Prevotellaceae bacterium]|jgi:hypothetical protein|nr:hypothetical protein [Prevotellaceae bacterium]
MKTNQFLFLALFAGFLSVAPIAAQVTIGSGIEPAAGALLDLKEHEADENGVTSTKGLLLPKVDLGTANPFGDLEDEKLKHIGLMVYNTNTTMGVGVYVWIGQNWLHIDGTIVKTALPAPDNVAIAENNLTFSSVADANQYKVYIYNDATELAVQTITSNSVTLNFAFSGTFDVKVQALDDTGTYTDSPLSDAVPWTVSIADQVDIPVSPYCDDNLFNPAAGNGYAVESDEDAAYFKWETDDQGNIVVTISGYDTHTETTAFRNNGININNLTVGGVAGSTVLTKVTNSATTQSFTPKAGITIPKGTAIVYSGFIEYRVLPLGSTGELDNLYPTATVNYTYGAVCPVAASEPTTLKVRPENAMLLTAVPEEVTILSLNNSLIDYNDQYLVFESLATSMGKDADWTKCTRLGESLRQHYEASDGSSKTAVRSQQWTHIILQEQSSKPRTDVEDFLASVRLWVDYIRENCPNPNAKILLPVNWAYTDSESWSDDVNVLYANYRSVAQELGVSLVPLALAYDLIYTTDGEEAKNALYSDNRHPTMLATYLAACAEYAAIYNETPVGSIYKPDAITQDQATNMQNMAWSTWQTHKPNETVDDFTGTVKYVGKVYDQYNNLMNETVSFDWTVDAGGTITTDGLFTGNATEGAYTVNATNSSLGLTNSASLLVTHFEKQTVPAEDDYFASIEAEITYQQDFNAIGASATASLPVGWKMEKIFTLTHTVFSGAYANGVKQTEYAGGTSLASNATNGLWNFGATNDATDRAIGGVSAGTADTQTHAVNFYLKIKNVGSTIVENFNISYDVEKYRKGAQVAGFRLKMYYSADGEVWTAAGNDFETFFASDSETAGCADAPCSVVSVTNKTLNQQLMVGGILYLAWNYSVAGGTAWNSAQVLALDNLSIVANEDSTP